MSNQYTENVWTCLRCGYPSNIKKDIRSHECDPKRVEDYKASKEKNR